jgi:hypothetical protein
MSAYICDNETISQVARFLKFNVAMHRVPFDLGLEDLAMALYEMNRDAVMQRYPDCPSSELPGPVDRPYRYEHSALAVPDGQSVKTLECLLYQCSEGTVCESDLYRRVQWALNGAKDALLERLCRDYREASWGAYEPPPDAVTVYSLSAMAHRPKHA